MGIQNETIISYCRMMVRLLRCYSPKGSLITTLLCTMKYNYFIANQFQKCLRQSEAETVLGQHLTQEDFKLMCLQALLQVNDLSGLPFVNAVCCDSFSAATKKSKTIPCPPLHLEPIPVTWPAGQEISSQGSALIGVPPQISLEEISSRLPALLSCPLSPSSQTPKAEGIHLGP